MIVGDGDGWEVVGGSWGNGSSVIMVGFGENSGENNDENNGDIIYYND